jgi:hypothetical protein
VEALMSSLLHELLHDLRQRCAHLLEELKKLSGLPEEARQYCERTQKRAERAGKIIEQFLADPGLNHPLLVRNYYHDYKRLTETVFNLEAGPVIALKHFQDDDRDITRIVARICREIGYPYSPPLCVALSSQYYWAIPAADLVFVPCSEPFHLLSLADLYQVLAHFILEREKSRLIAPLLRLIDGYFERQLREAQQNNWPLASSTGFGSVRPDGNETGSKSSRRTCLPPIGRGLRLAGVTCGFVRTKVSSCSWGPTFTQPMTPVTKVFGRCCSRPGTMWRPAALMRGGEN